MNIPGKCEAVCVVGAGFIASSDLGGAIAWLVSGRLHIS
jgi:hypothetical protein